MRKHITQAEILRIKKFLREGVCEIPDIQKQVFVHAECIQRVIDVVAAEAKPKLKYCSGV